MLDVSVGRANSLRRETFEVSRNFVEQRLGIRLIGRRLGAGERGGNQEHGNGA